MTIRPYSPAETLARLRRHSAARETKPMNEFARCGIQDGCESRDRCRADGECHYTGSPLSGPGAGRRIECKSYSGCCTLPDVCNAQDGCAVTQARSGVEAAERIIAVGGAAWAHEMPKLMDTTAKPTNPKDAIGSDKMPMHLWPKTASVMGALALCDGALKYGRANWRHAGVRASIYYDALERHVSAWFEGEDVDPDSGVPHLGHALACLAIIVDAQAAGKLTDDRQTPGGYFETIVRATPHVARVKAHHSGKSPRHYTIADTAV